MSKVRSELKIPEWCNGMPYNTRITSIDMNDFFSFDSKPNWERLIRDKRVPEPIRSNDGSVGCRNRRNKYWLLGDIRKLHAELLK